MKILQINKYFYSRGGTEKIFFDTIAGLRARGNEVIEFSTRDFRNLSSDFSEYFVNNIGDLSQDKPQSFGVYKKFIKNKEIEQNLQALILATEPEVAHLHNIYHHLSVSTFKILKKNNIPIVMTVHNVWPMCPNHRMMRGVDDKLCEACCRHKFYNCARFRCISQKFLPSLAGALESYYYWIKKIWKTVDCFICPSEFMRDKMLEWKFPKEKLVLARNPFVLSEIYPPLGTKILYLGRFHTEKGIKVLLAALPWLRQYEAIIAGSGPENIYVENFIKQYSLTNVKKIDWVEKSRWNEIIGQAKVIVVPSVFYESCSLTILEAIGSGRLVVGVNRGGTPEIIKDGVTGFLVEPENVESLARGIKIAMNTNSHDAQAIISAGRDLIKNYNDPEKYFAHLLEIYQGAINNKKLTK